MTIQYTSTLSFSAWEDSHETQINLEDFNILLLNCSHAREPWWISRSQFRKYIIRLISVFSHWRSRFLSSTFYRSVVLSSRIPSGISVFSEIKFTALSNRIKIRWLKKSGQNYDSIMIITLVLCDDNYFDYSIRPRKLGFCLKIIKLWCFGCNRLKNTILDTVIVWLPYR